VWKGGRHPICEPLRIGEENKKKKEEENTGVKI